MSEFLVALALATPLLVGCPGGTPYAERSPPDGTAPVTPPVDDDLLRAFPDDGAPSTAGVEAVGLSMPGGAGETGLDVVATPDGGGRVILGEPPLGPTTRLVTVSPEATVTGSVEVTGLRAVWEMHALSDGSVLLTGRLAEEDAAGFVRVDPATGAVEALAAVPLEDGTSWVEGYSALSADGRSVYLYVWTTAAGRQTELVERWDLATGDLLAARDVFAEMRSLAVPFVAPDPVGVLALPDGGVAVVTNVWQSAATSGFAPILLPYDAELQPTGAPIRLAPQAGGLTARVAAPGTDGALLVLLRGSPDSVLLRVDPDARTLTPLMAVPGFGFTDDLVTDPGGEWALLSAPTGMRSIDLSTGSTTEVDVGCPAVTSVTALAAAGPGSQALVLGGCPVAGRFEPILWLTQ